MNKEKMIAIKKKIKNNVPQIVSIATVIVATIVVIRTKNESTSQVKACRSHEKELLKFLGNGPDFIAIDRELANRIENGETFGHDLDGGTRVLLSRAAPKED